MYARIFGTKASGTSDCTLCCCPRNNCYIKPSSCGTNYYALSGSLCNCAYIGTRTGSTSNCTLCCRTGNYGYISSKPRSTNNCTLRCSLCNSG